MTTARHAFVAGHPALDFVNTVSHRGDPGRARDRLATLDDAIAWLADAAAAGALPATTGVAVGRASHGVLRDLAHARENLHAIFAALARGKPPPAPALARLDDDLRRCRAVRRLAATPTGAAWSMAPGAPLSRVALLPIVEAAVELVTGVHAARVSECQGAGCGSLFLDASPTRRRRWCSMADCGNRAKARRYRRQHGSAATAPGKPVQPSRLG